jgi:hypothetical protein
MIDDMDNAHFNEVTLQLTPAAVVRTPLHPLPSRHCAPGSRIWALSCAAAFDLAAQLPPGAAGPLPRGALPWLTAAGCPGAAAADARTAVLLLSPARYR